MKKYQIRITKDNGDYVAVEENESIDYISAMFAWYRAHSIKFEPDEHWCLKLYKTQDDVFKNNPILYWGVKKIEVVGVLDC